ncbi:hypothetical protein OPT61_g2208 [Boeremia exigua]|uniref:Uncharacterized protein n=1 Tax=Boeremia exigua TaxID=749465 RepID=A0ACC2IMD6_9PLEO|nr:hypothetical protein OPT61_g2208 [Boeremia exigua]
MASHLPSLALCAGVIAHITLFSKGEWDRHAPKILLLHILLSVSIFTGLFLGTGCSGVRCLLETCLISSALMAGLSTSMLVYRVLFHPLRSFPGPLAARVSSFWAFREQWPDLKLYIKLRDIHDRYGDFVRIRPREISIAHPDAVNDIHGPRNRIRKGEFYEQIHPAQNLQFIRNPERHKQQRRFWDKAFQTKALQEYTPRMIKHYEQIMGIFSTHAASGVPVDVSELFLNLFFDVVSDLTFGESFNTLTTGERNPIIGEFLNHQKSIGFIILNMWMFHLVRSIPAVAERMLSMMEWYTKAVAKRKEMKDISPDLYTYLSQSDTFDSNDIHESQLVIIAGADTNAITVSNVCYLLCQHPGYQQELFEELVDLSIHNEILEDKHLLNKPVLLSIINETLRLYPPVPGGLQRVTPPEGATIAGRFVPGDTIVSTPTYALHRGKEPHSAALRDSEKAFSFTIFLLAYTYFTRHISAMPPRKQKMVMPRQPGRKPGQPRKSHSVTPAPESTNNQRLFIKLKFDPNSCKDPQSTLHANQPLINTPSSDDVPIRDNFENDALPNGVGQGMRRGTRQRTKAHQPDMAFGSEMDSLIATSFTIGKVEEDDDDGASINSPPTIFNIRAPASYGSPDTIRGADAPPRRYNGPVSQDIYNILNTLRSSAEIQVDLPDIWMSDNADVAKPYTAIVLTELYIQCYEGQLWNLCDLIADTWIRALQTANRRTQRSKNVQDHMWRKNVALEQMFANKKKGFKKDVFEFDLDVEDPEIANDVTEINPERLRDLYAHTGPRCGARLLWADAMALCGKKMEHEITRRSSAWPEELFYHLMCTSLRMVGRKLTLKIEETYEGAWCRYHEHVKHGLPCYRELAWKQKGKPDEDGDSEKDTASGKRRARQTASGNDQGDAKRVRFDAGGAGDRVIGFGDIDAEDESEEEG